MHKCRYFHIRGCIFLRYNPLANSHNFSMLPGNYVYEHVIWIRDKLHDLCTEYKIYFCYYNFVYLVHTLHVLPQ